MAEGFAAADKSKPYIPLNSVATDRGYKDGEATATCMCGAVQLAFVSPAPQSGTKRPGHPPCPSPLPPTKPVSLMDLTLPPAN